MTKEQLILSHLVLFNFKSYAGRHVVGPFHEKMSCIVGANGAGKSNLIDAMLFVFGRRAQQLRHRKVADLIHRSAAFPNLDTVRVEVHFRRVLSASRSQGGEAVEGSEFVIAREATSNSSRYFIDGATVTQSDVFALLKSHDVDLAHNRFLILQGEIEQIAMMKPKGQLPKEEGLLEYIEDIIGSNVHLEEIEKLKEQLVTINQEVQEKRDKMKSAQANFDSLKEPLRLAQAWCDSQRKVIYLKAQLEKKYLKALNEDAKKAQEAVEKAKADWALWKEDQKESKKIAANYESEVKAQSALVQKAEKMFKVVSAEFAELEKQDNELSAKQSHCLKRAQSLQKEIATMQADEIRFQAKAKECREKSVRLKRELPELQKSAEKYSAELETLEKGLQKEFDQLRGSKTEADNALRPELLALQELRNTAELLKTEVAVIQRKRTAAQDEKAAMEQKKQISSKKKAAFDEAARSAEKAKKSYAKHREEANALRAQHQKMRSDLNVKKQELESLESSFRDSKHKAVTIPRLLQAKEDKTLKGIVDRLWNLGEVPTELETAFAAVAGSEYLVVEKMVDAQAAVEFVRKNKLGRVTCIVLERVRKELEADLKALRRKQLPAQASGLLLDYIKLKNPDHQIAFFYVVRDSLLVSDLDTGRAVAFGNNNTRWKVVTKDGQVIDKAGTMTGGGHTKTSSTMVFRQEASRNVQTTDVQQIEKGRTLVRDMEAEVAALKAKVERCEALIDDLDKEISQLDANKCCLAAELNVAKQDVEHFTTITENSMIPELSTEEKAKLQQLHVKLYKTEQAIQAQESVVKEKQDAVDRVAAKIENVGGTRRRQLKEVMLRSVSDLEKAKAELKEADVEIEVCVKAVQRLSTAIPTKREAAAKEQAAAAEYDKKKDELTDKAEVVLTKKDELEKILKEQRALEQKKLTLLKEHQESSKHTKLKETELQTSLQDKEQVLALARGAERKREKTLLKLREDYDAIPKLMVPDTHSDSPLKALPTGKSVKVEDESEKSAFDTILEECTDEVLEQLDEMVIQCEIKKETESLALKKIDQSVIGRFNDSSEKLRKRFEEYKEISNIKEGLSKSLDQKELQRLKEFTNGFAIIAEKVKELYQMITHEGDAELELADPSDPFTEGLIFSVRPPRKSWKRIQNLSGGEKTVSSLALVFALHNYRPTPIYFLDEIDAALDFQNVATIAFYLADQAQDAQFIVISLRNYMFEIADRLVGVYKKTGMTQLVVMDPDSFVDEEIKEKDEQRKILREPKTFKSITAH